VAFEILLAASQGCLIGLNFMKAPANFRRFLSGHAAMLVKFHWVVRHDRLPFLSLGKPCVCNELTKRIGRPATARWITAGGAFSEYRGVPKVPRSLQEARLGKTREMIARSIKPFEAKTV
jgi:hypothetical protein